MIKIYFKNMRCEHVLRSFILENDKYINFKCLIVAFLSNLLNRRKINKVKKCPSLGSDQGHSHYTPMLYSELPGRHQAVQLFSYTVQLFKQRFTRRNILLTNKYILVASMVLSNLSIQYLVNGRSNAKFYTHIHEQKKYIYNNNESGYVCRYCFRQYGQIINREPVFIVKILIY